MATEYRVVWKRKDRKRQAKRYVSRKLAEKFMLIFGPEPWRAWAPNKGPDSLVCCRGHECGCGGLTFREQEAAKEIPPLEYVYMEQREVGKWENLQPKAPQNGQPTQTQRTK